MKKRYFLFGFLLAVLFIFLPESKAQQILDTANVTTVDNLFDNNTGVTATPGTILSGPFYAEYPATTPVSTENDGWWTNTIGFNGSHRRSSRVGTASPAGAHAIFAFDVPVTDYYVVYHHMVNSANSSTRSYVTFRRFGEGAVVDSFIYSERSNNLGDGRGSWYPLGIVQVFASDSALSIEIGCDSTGTNVLRVDAVRILRSIQSGPDIEFGNRRSDETTIDPGTGDTLYHASFFENRAPFQFPQTTFKWNGHSDFVMPVYNLGSSDLTISGFSTMTNRFSVLTPTPIVIQPGGKQDITIRFSPIGEEVTIDTLLILSNDALEPEAKLPLVGEGINYNFILNASLGGTEPHWNAPPPGATYEEIGTFLSSIPSPFTYPIPGGNLRSTVNTGADLNIASIYRFQIPDTLFGSYYLEYSGPAGSPNAAQNLTIDVITPFYSNPNPALGDTQRVTGFNERAITSVVHWARIGGNQVFSLNGGGQTVVRYTNPNQGGDFLRADLIRIRLVPIAPDISTSLDPTRLLTFGSVSVFDSIRQAQFNFQRNFIIGSNGETPLGIDTMYLTNNDKFSIDNLPQFPITLPAIDGQYNLLVSFLPEEIRLHSDTLKIVSSDPQDSIISIRISGQGVGTGITTDDQDPLTYFFPDQILDWTGAPDPANMDKWYRVAGSGINLTRMLAYIYFNPSNGVQKVEWFPEFPFNPNNPGVTEPDSFEVFVQIPTNSPNSSPAAHYRIKHFNGLTDTIISQLNRTLNDGKIPLGRYIFLRGGHDSFGSGTIFGSVELINDTALVSAFYADSIENTARRDSHFVRADALILEQAGIIVGVTYPNLMPTEYSLSQNFPNPFNPTTQIRFTLPQMTKIELKIYDILGREVKTLLTGEQPAGIHTIEWDGRNNYGTQVSSGVYIYRLNAGKYVQSKKMLMLK